MPVQIQQMLKANEVLEKIMIIKLPEKKSYIGLLKDIFPENISSIKILHNLRGEILES